MNITISIFFFLIKTENIEEDKKLFKSPWKRFSISHYRCDTSKSDSNWWRHNDTHEKRKRNVEFLVSRIEHLFDRIWEGWWRKKSMLFFLYSEVFRFSFWLQLYLKFIFQILSWVESVKSQNVSCCSQTCIEKNLQLQKKKGFWICCSCFHENETISWPLDFAI